MSVNVTVDTSQVDEFMAKLVEKLGDMGTILEDFLQNRVVPSLESEAGSRRGVRTGTYMGTWEAATESSTSAVITTEADYWIFLEGGTSRGIKPVPVVRDVIEAMGDDLAEYIGNALVATE